MSSKVIKLEIDGKKVTKGKGKEMGDIDCWSYELKPALKCECECVV